MVIVVLGACHRIVLVRADGCHRGEIIPSVRGEIESMTGKLNYLKNQVSFSTLAVSYYQVNGTDFGFASKFFQSLKDGWDNLLAFLIGLVSLWPFVLGIAAIIFWWIKRRKRTQQKS